MMETQVVTPRRVQVAKRRKPAARSDTPVLKQFASFADYQQANAHIFPTEASLRWFYRVNRDRLLGAGAVVEIARRLFVHAPKFEHELVEISQIQAGDGVER